MKQTKIYRTGKGFTLLEILVVISIIGILVAVGAVNYTEIQKKGRDSQRIQTAKQIQSAQEQLYTMNNYYYKFENSTVCAIPTFFPEGAKDPRHPTPTITCYSCPSTAGDSERTSYCFAIPLEDTAKTNCAGCADTCTANTGATHYCVTNVQ